MASRVSDYGRRMDRVADAIARALRDNRSPTLEEMASAAALSPFHFHRLYRLLTGETVAETVRRLKLAHALERVNGGDSVTEAAHAAGYGSSQSLAKAVRQRVGASITELRSSDRLGREVSNLQTRDGGTAMTFELIDHSPVRIACRIVTGPYDRLNLGFRSLFEDFCSVASPDEIEGVYGIPVDDPRHVPEQDHRFIAALALSSAVVDTGPTIEVRDLGGGRFARTRLVGPYSSVPAAIDELYGEIIAAGRELRDSETFLHYVDQPGAADGADVIHESDIYVPVA